MQPDPSEAEYWPAAQLCDAQLALFALHTLTSASSHAVLSTLQATSPVEPSVLDAAPAAASDGSRMVGRDELSCATAAAMVPARRRSIVAAATGICAASVTRPVHAMASR